MKEASFHILIYTCVFFAVGIVKPKWALFFLEKPTRFLIVTISMIGFMAGWTMTSEAIRQEKMTQQSQQTVTQEPSPEAEIPTVKQ
jgi:hypothetical protein